jgi:type IV secretory pathway VirB10-like protein
MLRGPKPLNQATSLNRNLILGIGVLLIGLIFWLAGQQQTESEKLKKAQDEKAPSRISAVPAELTGPIVLPPEDLQSPQPDNKTPSKSARTDLAPPPPLMLVDSRGANPRNSPIDDTSGSDVFAKFDDGDRLNAQSPRTLNQADMRAAMPQLIDPAQYAAAVQSNAPRPASALRLPNEDIQQNRFDDKTTFVTPAPDHNAAFKPFRHGPVIAAGTIFHITLTTALNTDLPGLITGRVNEAVYDSQTQQVLLIPAGSTILGQVNSDVTYGQNRAQIKWLKIERTDGEILLNNLPATDENGAAGAPGEVNTHFWSNVSSATLALLIGAGGNLARSQNQATLQQQNAGNVAGDTIAQEAAILAQQLTAKSLKRAPTITKELLEPVAVIVRDTVALPPFENMRDANVQ